MAWWDLGGSKPFRKGVHLGMGFGHESRNYITGTNRQDPPAEFQHRGIQNFLPEYLRMFDENGRTPFALGLEKGTKNLAELMANPGGLGSNFSEAIAPRVAMEQQTIGRGTSRGLAE